MLRRTKQIKRSIYASAGCYLVYKLLPSQNQYDINGTANSTVNLFRASLVFGLSAYDYISTLRGYTTYDDNYYDQRDGCHRRSAEKILWQAKINKGIYYKGGQYLGNLNRIIPQEYVKVLSVLQDSGPPEPYDAVKTVIEYDTNLKISDIFDFFEKKPVAAASQAQVHKAKLKNGKEVAVKIQFPTLRSQYALDIKILENFFGLSDWILKKYGYTDISMSSIYKSFKNGLRDELDFRIEVRNSQLTKKQFSNNPEVYVPEVVGPSTSRLIIMEFVKGAKINDPQGIENLGLDTKESARILINTFAKMIFYDGHVHCDAHPGNQLIRQNPDDKSKPQLVLLDHGFYIHYEDEFLTFFCKLWKSMVTFDNTELKKLAATMGVEKYYNYLPLIFQWRLNSSSGNLGDGLKKEEATSLNRNGLTSFAIISQIWDEMPDNMIYIIRACNLISGHNAVRFCFNKIQDLGGTMRQRLIMFTDEAYRYLYPNFLNRFIRRRLFRLRLFIYENYRNFFNYLYPSDVIVI